VQQEEHHKNNAKTGGMHLFTIYDEDLISSYNCSCVAARLKCMSKKYATTPDNVADELNW
jgi:hypothetical protein